LEEVKENEKILYHFEIFAIVNELYKTFLLSLTSSMFPTLAPIPSLTDTLDYITNIFFSM